MVQWLGLHTFTAEVPRSYKLHSATKTKTKLTFVRLALPFTKHFWLCILIESHNNSVRWLVGCYNFQLGERGHGNP